MAAPLAVLIVSISVLNGALPAASQSPELSASVMRLSEGEVLRLPHGRALLYSGQGFSVTDESAAFLDGSALIATDGFLEIKVAGIKISVVSGAYHLSYHGKDINIAALTSPVLVREGSRLMVVPIGTQWRLPGDEKLPLLQAGYPLWQKARQIDAFPERFFVRQLQNLAFLPEEEDELLSAGSEPLPLWTKLPTLRVGSTRESVESEWNEDVLGAFRSLIESGDRDAADSFLHNEDYSDVLESEEAWQMMVRLLVREPEGPVRSFLLSILTADEDFWLLASLHPDYRAEVWSMFTEHKNPEAVTLRLFLLPTSNMAKQAVPTAAMQRWVYELSKLAEGEKAVSLVHMTVEQHLPLVSRFDQMGYPERSRVLALALRKLVENTKVTLASELTSELHSVTSFERVSLDNPPPVEVPVVEEEVLEDVVEIEAEPEPEVVLPSYSPDVVENRAYSVMRDIGALFTVETSIDAVAPNTARVRNIIFPGKSGDKTIDFHIDVARGEVKQVVLGSKEYPYALSIEAFRDWIRK